MSSLTANRPLRPGLTELLADENARCSGCGICVNECNFLKLYGSPRAIAAAYDPEDPKKNVVCFECSLCGLCTAVCPEGLDPQALFLEMRREAVDRGYGLFPEHKGLLGYERTGMSRRFSWYGLPRGCTTVFFPGCALPGTRPAATLAVYQRLTAEIPALGLVLDCCAKPSHDLGRERFFTEMFTEMAEWLQARGVERILVACPNCYKVFSEYGRQFKTETVYEALAALAPEPAIHGGAAAVTIHDPCVVRFANPPQEAVRKLLAGSGYTIEEMPHSRRTALCCGEGGTVAPLAPDLADSWGKQRAGEAGERRVVTYCAGCANHLGKKLKVSHLLDIVCQTPKPSAGLVTYLNRLRLKARLKRLVPAETSRERTISGSSGVLRPLLFLAIMVAVIILLRASGASHYLEPDNLRALFARFGVVAPLAYMALYTVAPALMLPGLPISIAGATVFGPFWGVVYTIIGATMGACVAFLIARYAARDWVERRLIGSRWNRLDSETEKNGWKAVAFTRLIPLFPFNLLNFAFGLTKIPFLQYAVATFIFMLPGTIAFVTFSSSLLGLLKGKVSSEFFIGIALLVAVSLLPKFVRWYSSRERQEAPPQKPWSLKRSLQRKGGAIALLGALSASAYVLIEKFFWAINAHLYTIEFNLLFVAHRLKDGDLAAFIEYLRPMSAGRGALMALVCQVMRTFAFPFAALPAVTPFTAAFGPLIGGLYAFGASMAATALAAVSGRFLLGDLLPLYNRRSGREPLSPPSAWLCRATVVMAAIPGVPLLICGVWAGALRLPLLRTLAAVAAGLTVRTLIQIASQ